MQKYALNAPAPSPAAPAAPPPAVAEQPGQTPGEPAVFPPKLYPATPAFPVPTLDISGQTQRHTIIAKGTPETYQGHPTTVLLPDGKTLIAVWTLDHGGNCGPAALSTNGGLTWTRIDDRFPADYRHYRNCPSIYRLTDPSGNARLWIFASRHDANPRPPHQLHRVVSEDDGLTWREAPALPVSAGMPPTSIIPLNDPSGSPVPGAYIAHIQMTGPSDPPKTSSIWQMNTTDGGLTWSEPRKIASEPGAILCEPCAIRSPDGRQICLVLRENKRLDQSRYALSDDEGLTWSAPKPTPVWLTGDRHAAKYAPDGRLVIAFRDMSKTSPAQNHFVAWIGNYSDIANATPAAGYRVKLIQNYRRGEWRGLLLADCGYPALEVLPGGAILATTYAKYTPGPEKNYVLLTRFTLPELDNLLQTLSARQPAVSPENAPPAAPSAPENPVETNATPAAPTPPAAPKLTGIALYLMASKAVLNPDNTVARLTDISPRQTHLLPVTPGASQLIPGALNGHPVIATGPGGFPLPPPQAAAHNPGPHGLSVFIVARRADPSDVNVNLLRKGATSLNRPGWRITTEPRVNNLSAVAITNLQNRRSCITPLPSSWAVVSFIINPAQNSVEASLNNAPFAGSGLQRGVLTNLANNDPLEIPEGIQFAEIAIFDHALTPDETARVSSLLTRKYNLP
ncbi:MAG: glycoside hydrolase [Opitutaceae bacterium]|nr:glycoside hydrolase [Opitutaceae bacterium]